jgi:RHS repeat-associated protein
VTSQNDTDVVLAQYKYFADDRRASKAVTNRGDFDATTYFFYDGHEVIEERNGSNEMTQQYIYGPRSRRAGNELVMISGENGTLWAYQDRNWNIMGLTTTFGTVQEEYNYTPYGRLLARRHTAFGDSDGDGDVDSTDRTAFNAAYGTSTGDQGWNRNFDADLDGTIGSFDQAAFNKTYDPAGRSLIVPNRAWSPSANPIGFTGRRLDPESHLMHYRLRAYHPTFKTFIQRDPLGYIDGPNMCEYATSNPIRFFDPWGTTSSGDAGGSGSAAYLIKAKDALMTALKRLADNRTLLNRQAAKEAVRVYANALETIFPGLNANAIVIKWDLVVDAIYYGTLTWEEIVAILAGETVEVLEDALLPPLPDDMPPLPDQGEIPLKPEPTTPPRDPDTADTDRNAPGGWQPPYVPWPPRWHPSFPVPWPLPPDIYPERNEWCE